jgi:hypothetical protein
MRQETLTIQATDFSEMLTPAGPQCFEPENQNKNFHYPENFRAHI